MMEKAKKKRLKKHFRLTSIIVGCLCFIGTVTLTVVNRRYEESRWTTAFESACDDITSSIEMKIKGNINKLRTIKAFYFSSREVTKKEFDRFLRTFKNDKFIIGWAPKVKVEKIVEFEKQTGEFYGKQYHVSSGNYIDNQYDFKFPVQYVNPLKKNILGFDLTTASFEITNGIKKSIRSNKIVTVALSDIPLQNKNGWMLLLGNVENQQFQKSSTPLEDGVLFGIYYGRNILQSSMNSSLFDGIEVKLEEATSNSSKILFAEHKSKLEKIPSEIISLFPISNLRKTTNIKIGGKEFIVGFQSVPAFFNMYATNESIIIFFSGLILTFFISFLVWHLSTKSIQVEKEVVARTKELMESRQRLSSSAEFLTNILDSFPHPIFAVDMNYNIKKANKAAALISDDLRTYCNLTKKENSDAQKKNSLPEYILKTGKTVEKTIERKLDGGLKTLKIVAAPFIFENENQVVMTIIDITSEKKLNAKRLQSQKMEAIGQLAGGIAHDLNNVIQVINGYSELAIPRFEPNHPVYNELLQIKKSCDKAAKLTKSILAFGRKQSMQLKILNLNDLVADFKTMLERVIPENISMEFIQCNENSTIEADPNMMEQVLMNLCVNARDAMMPNGGKLEIRTRRKKIQNPQFLEANELKDTEYIILSVQDSGSGMQKEIIDKIFEPFFTTKPIGKGTGLGLSTVFGIIKQHNGAIIPKSKLGKGTVFSIYLPASDKSSAERSITSGQVTFNRKKTVILLAEDNEDVRKLNAAILKANKFHVLSVPNGKKAYQLFQAKKDLIDILILDVVMPEMTGTELYSKLSETEANVPVLFISGFAKESIQIDELVKFNNVDFLQKPFSQNELLEKISKIRQDFSGTVP